MIFPSRAEVTQERPERTGTVTWPNDREETKVGSLRKTDLVRAFRKLEEDSSCNSIILQPPLEVTERYGNVATDVLPADGP